MLQQILTPPEFEQVTALTQTQPFIKSVWTLYEESRRQRAILTQHIDIDALLGRKGLALGQVCEIVGQPGAGQTELCLRLCLSVQISEERGGVGLNAVYIDTSGTFTYSGAKLALQRLQFQLGEDATIVNDQVAERINVFRVHCAQELIALMYQFEKVCESIGNVGLLVVNSISWPFLVSAPENMVQRQFLQAEVARMLSEIAEKHQVAVVVVSQAKAPSENAIGRTMDGDVWGRISSTRIALSRTSDGHTVELLGSSMYPTGVAQILGEL
ncbi:DNA repair protein rad51c [Coemansia sp. RSA 2603]|nr:DNA repair protein rad51c [Coemansia sp. RSA 2603]